MYTCIISEVEPKLSFTKPKSHVLTVGSFDLTCSFKATLKGSLKQSESPNISDQEAIRTGYDKVQDIHLSRLVPYIANLRRSCWLHLRGYGTIHHSMLLVNFTNHI